MQTHIHALENLYRQPSNFSQDVLEVARQWADEIRPGLRIVSGVPADPAIRNGEVSAMSQLEERVRSFGVSSSQSLGELAFIGLDLSRKQEQELAKQELLKEGE